jgi:branched-subunit amino acid transport protein
MIVLLGLTAFVMRAMPQLFLTGRRFPETWDRWLRYVSYSLICSIISITLFISAGRVETAAAPRRAIALAVVILVAYRTRSAVVGMICGVGLVLLLSRFC